MRRLLAALLACATPLAAHAGACCVASTTSIPTRLGECETWLFGVGLQGDVTVGRWDGQGALATSSLAEQAVIGTVAAGYRWDRKGQVALSLPVWLQHKATDDLSVWGGGPGDLRASVTWDPIEETLTPPGGWAWPVPVFNLGVRVPTGRAWDQAKGLLGEDVTGLAGPAVTAGVSAERVAVRTPYTLAVDADLGIERGRVVPVLRTSLGVGRTLGTRWTVMGTVRHVHAWSDGHDSGRSTVGARVIHGQMLRWRGWAGVEADVPLPGIGKANQRLVSLGAGVALVR